MMRGERVDDAPLRNSGERAPSSAKGRFRRGQRGGFGAFAAIPLRKSS